MSAKTLGVFLTRYLLFLGFSSLFIKRSESLIIEGTISTKQQWVFVARFCYKHFSDENHGAVDFYFEYPMTLCCSNPQLAILYYDTQWKDVYPKSDMPCQSKVDRTVPGNNQILRLEPYGHCDSVTRDGNQYVVCKGSRKFISSRARWWYIVFSHCNASAGVQMKYRMELTNGNTFWTKHFSADEQVILEPNIAFFLATFIMFFCSVILASVLKTRQLFHYTYKMFMVSLFLELLSLMFDLIYYVEYGKTGIPNRAYKVIEQGCHSVGDMALLLFLILLAKGWTVTRGRISSSGQVKLGVFFTLYSIAYAALYIYEAKAFDPGEVLYLYESPAGVGLCVMRLIAWIWFCYGTFFTLKHYPNKSAFYYPFWFFYTFWFLSGPVFVLIATYVLDPWVRAKVINGINRTVAFCAYCFFLVLTRPSAANTNFPYHVRTSQIGVINSDSAENFAKHQYAPSAEGSLDSNGRPFSDIAAMFSTRSSEQVTFGHIPNTNNSSAAQNGQKLLNGTASSTTSSTNSSPSDHANQPNFNLFQASQRPPAY